jgi:hypothetical protein
MLTYTERNRVWRSDDLRTLRSSLGTIGNIRAAAKRLDRSAAEVEGMVRDLGWNRQPLAPMTALAHSPQRRRALGGGAFDLVSRSVTSATCLF